MAPATTFVILGILAVAFIGLAVTIDAGSTNVLVVEAQNGTELFVVPVESGSTVTLEYTHSVENTTIRDVYTVEETRLAITRMEFRSFGAGLPSEANVTRTENGTFHYRPPDRRTGDLLVATGHIADHDLIIDGTRHDLVAVANGSTVRLSIEKRFVL